MSDNELVCNVGEVTLKMHYNYKLKMFEDVCNVTM